MEKELDKKLKQARTKTGLTQLEVAEKSSLNVNYYAKVERGENKISFDNLKKIAKVLHIKSIEFQITHHDPHISSINQDANQENI